MDSKINSGQIAQQMIEAAKTFESSERDNERKSKRIAWYVATGAMVLAGIALIAATVVFFIRVPNPPTVLRVDNATGAVEVLRTLAEFKADFGEATDQYYLRRYVEARESYDWETIQDMYDTTRLMSAPKERSEYVSFYTQPNSPEKVLKDQARVIVKAGTITFVGKTALVHFSKIMKPFGGQSTTDYWVATIAFEYENIPMTDHERLLNPVGFQVTSYRVDRDVSRTGSAHPATAAGS